MEIQKDDLFRDYITDSLTVREIAEKYNSTKWQISSLLQKYGIRRGPPFKSLSAKYTGQKHPLTKEFLIKHYIEKSKTVKQIMAEFSLSGSKINKALRKHGITKPSELKTKINPNVITKEVLEAMYYVEELSIFQIGEKLDVDYGVVVRLFEKHGISRSKILRYERVRRKDELRSINKKIKKIAKDIDRCLSRVREIRKGTPMSSQSRLKSALAHVTKASLFPHRTRPEQQLAILLKDLRVDFEEQFPLGIYDPEVGLLSAYCLDFYVEKYETSKFPIVIQVDSRYHHNLLSNIEKDEYEGLLLADKSYFFIRLPREKIEFQRVNTPWDNIDDSLKSRFYFQPHITIRLWDDEVNKLNIERLLKEAATWSHPVLLRYYYPQHEIRKPSKQYLISQKNIEIIDSLHNLPFFEVLKRVVGVGGQS